MTVPAVLAAAETVGKLTAVSGSLSDLISLGFTIADHLKAQDGLKANRHAFVLPLGDGEKAAEPASAAGPPARRAAAASARTPVRTPPLTLTKTGNSVTILDITSGSAALSFGLDSYLVTGEQMAYVYVVNLWTQRGFDTNVGDQAEIEFSGTELDGGYLLSLDGFVNEWLRGFFRFSGDILVRKVDPGSTANAVVPQEYRLVGRGGSMEQAAHGFRITF